MAIVGKIREKSGLLVFVVALALLLFIIPFDTIYQSFQGGGEQPLGEIYGKPIYDSDWKFNAKVQRSLSQYGSIPEEYRIQQEMQVWNQTMLDTLFNTEFAKLGIRVGGAEYVNNLVLGDYPDDYILENFSYEAYPDGPKELNKDSVAVWFKGIETQLATLQGDQKRDAEANIYFGLELPFKNARMRKKYNAMAKYGTVATTNEASKKLIAKNAVLSLSYVAQEVNTVPDTAVVVKDADVKAYYEKHKNDAKWKQTEDTRGLEFAFIDIVPSEMDAENLAKEMASLKNAFALATNDSAFVNANSDTKIGANQQDPSALDVMPFNEFDIYSSPFSNETNAELLKAQKGDVVGPFSYISGNGTSKVVLAKSVNSFSRAETEVRHILVSTQGLLEGVNDVELAAKKKLADSLVTVLKADNSKFGILATQFTDDKDGFSMNQGYYYVFPEAGLVPEFKDFALSNEVGSIASVKTQFGYHVMEVTKKGDFPHSYFAYVEKSAVPSKATKISTFETIGLPFMDAAEKDFDAAATEFNVEKGEEVMYLNYPISQTFGYVSELVNWAFADDRTVGEVSGPIETKDNKYMIVKIKSMSTYGTPTYEAVSEQMKEEVLKEKKLAYLVGKVGKPTSLDEAATKLSGAISGVQTDAKINLDMPSFPGMGADPKAVAKAFLIKNTNEVTVVEGNQGIYVIVVNERNITPAPAETLEEKKMLTDARQSYVESNLIMSLVKAADMRDWRMKAKVAYANQH